jgi:hypothetical protein
MNAKGMSQFGMSHFDCHPRFTALSLFPFSFFPWGGKEEAGGENATFGRP